MKHHHNDVGLYSVKVYDRQNQRLDINGDFATRDIFEARCYGEALRRKHTEVFSFVVVYTAYNSLTVDPNLKWPTCPENPDD